MRRSVPLRNKWAAVCFACCLAVGASGALAQDGAGTPPAPTQSADGNLNLTLPQARQIAQQAALTGRFALARNFALALLDADPDDRAALIVLAAVLPKLGEASEGRRAGQRAFQLSQSRSQRYEAARLVALAAANEDRFTLSQFWLRRAAANAPDEAAFLQTQSDYRGIRSLNPWSINLGFGFSPSNNVNGGSKTALNIIDGLPIVGILSGDAQALPGIAATADVRLSYTLSDNERARTALTARAFARAVWLSEEAQKIAPASRNSDFGFQVLEFGIDHRRRIGNDIFSAKATVGANWFGGDLYSGNLRGTLGYSRVIGERTRVDVSTELMQTYDTEPWTPNNVARSVTASLTQITQSGDRVSGQFSYDAQSSDNLNERFTSLTAQVSYAWAEPLGPMQVSVAAGAAQTLYPDYTIIFPVPGGREDIRLFGSVTAVFTDIDYAGFVPVMTFSVQDTQSNVSRFDRNEYSLNIGIRSSF